MRHRFDRWQVSLMAVIMLMLGIMLGMSLGGAAYAWSPPAGENVVLDNARSVRGKDTVGTEQNLLTLYSNTCLNTPAGKAILFTVNNAEKARLTYTGSMVLPNGVSYSAKNAGGTVQNLLTLWNNTCLNAPSGKDILFTVNNGEKARLTSTGNVGIGDSTPTEGKLVVNSTSGTGIYSNCTSDDAVHGSSVSRYGVVGQSTSGYGVLGSSISNFGVYGMSNDNRGVYGSSGTSYGVYGESTSSDAGYFNGNVTVTGTLTKGTDNFKIDHPQDPENKYLIHSVIESPDMKNVYDGTILLDGNGEAVVELPSYFESLNRDFRYQLTCIGGYAPVYIAEEISGNQFKIAGGSPEMKVSWQVTGIRQDAFANAHPVVVEQEKPDKEKGLYLHWKEWGQPEEKGINTAALP